MTRIANAPGIPPGFPIDPSFFGNFSTDAKGNAYEMALVQIGSSFTPLPPVVSRLDWDGKQKIWSQENLQFEESFNPGNWDVGPDGRTAVSGQYVSGNNSGGAIYYLPAGISTGSNGVYNGQNPDLPINDFVTGLAYDGANNLYYLTNNTDLVTVPNQGAGSDITLSKAVNYLTRDYDWNVILVYQDGTPVTLGTSFPNIGFMKKGGGEDIFNRLAALLGPSQAWADGGGNQPLLLQTGNNLGVVTTHDGRWYALGLDGRTVYGFDQNQNILCQLSLQEGPYDPFQAEVMTYNPPSGQVDASTAGGELVFLDSFGNVRTGEIPMPPNFTPLSTATPTSTFTPTSTATPTPTPSPVGSIVPTDTPTVTSTYTVTQAPTETPSGDSFGLWLKATDQAALGTQSHQQALYFNNKFWVIATPTVVFSPNKVVNTTWSSQEGVSWVKGPNTSFPGRSDFGAVVFAPTSGPAQGTQMWVMGGQLHTYQNGRDHISGTGSDVWYSANGTTWTQAINSAAFGQRSGFASLVFNGMMWVIGGTDGDGNVLNDVWYSADGVTWNPATNSAPFPARTFHQCLAYNGQLWVMGGEDFFGTPFNDVWSSPDGETWTEQTAQAAWSPRFGFISTALNGEMVVSDGVGWDSNDNDTTLSDLFHSSDGINWTATTYSPVFPARSFASEVTENGRSYILGGGQSDVWYSTTQFDPNSVFTQATGDAGFIPRSNPALAVFSPTSGTWAGQNRLWMVGGTNSDIGTLGDVWSTADGVNWNMETDDTPFFEQSDIDLLPQRSLICFPFMGKLWIFGSTEWTSTNNKVQVVYNTPDGANWSLVSDRVPFTGVDSAFTNGGQLWVVDSNPSTEFGSNNADTSVYNSPDGIHWQKVSDLGDLEDAAYAVFKGSMWLFGGRFGCEAGSCYNSGSLSSVNGVNWNTASAPITIGDNYQAQVLNGSVYLIGDGNQDNPGVGADEWISSDGAHWKQGASTLAFGQRIGIGTAVFNNRLWVVGGEGPDGSSLGDVWTAPGVGYVPPAQWTPTPLVTPTNSPTPTPTFTNTPAITPTPTETYTGTFDLTATSTFTPTPTFPSAQPLTGRDWFQGSQSQYGFTFRKNQTTTLFAPSTGSGQGVTGLWVIGGSDQNGNFLGDIWKSPDGVQWSEASAFAPFGPRTGQAAVSFNGKLWMLGGETGHNGSVTYNSDIWNSTDGVNWTEAVTQAPWPARAWHGAAVFNGQIWILGGTGPSGNFKDVWNSTDGLNWNRMPDAAYGTRAGFGCMVWPGSGQSNLLWVVGGNGANDVWSTADGLTWSQATTSAGFDFRSGFGTAVADGKLWVLGGDDIYGAAKNDVWYSCDGTYWYKDTQSASFSPRAGLSALAFTPAPNTVNPAGSPGLWVVGGGAGSNGVTDAFYNGGNWYSLLGNDPPCLNLPPTATPTPTPGLYGQWTQATSAAGFNPRAAHASVTFNNKMWVIGGGDDNQFYNDSWSSPDGVNWTEATANAGFNPRIDHGAAVFNGKIFVVGGQNFDGSFDNDVWSSNDGANWTEAVTQAPFSPRTGISLFVYDAGQGPRLWMTGGIDENDNTLSEVWNSSDGVNWSQQRGSLPAPAAYQTAVSFNSNVYFIDGQAADGSLNTVEYLLTNYGDGPVWGTVNPAPPLTARQDAAGMAFDNLLFISGGMTAEDIPTGDLWYDGNNWNQANNQAGYGFRSDHTMLEFNPASPGAAPGAPGDRLWVIGGWNGDGYDNDVWYTGTLLNATATPTPTTAYNCPTAASWPVTGSGGIALDGSGNLYAADDSTGGWDFLSAQGGNVAKRAVGAMVEPSGVALDGTGLVYVTDNFLGQVMVFNSGGATVTRFGGPSGNFAGLNTPLGIAVDSIRGVIYVADQGNHRIQLFNLSGSPLSAWGTTGDGGNGAFDAPTGVALDNQGNVYVTDDVTGLVQEFSNSGAWITQWSAVQNTPLATAEWVAVGAFNNWVYVSDGSGTVGVFNSTGNHLGDTQAANSLPFEGVEGVAAGNGFWCAVDEGNNRVVELTGCPLAQTPYPTWTPTQTTTPSPMATYSPTPTYTVTPSVTSTLTSTDTPTPTPTSTNTWTQTPTASPTASFTFTPTFTSSNTSSPSATNTPTYTPAVTSTFTKTPTKTRTMTFTATNSPTSTPTSALTATRTSTLTKTPTKTGTPTKTPTVNTPTKTNTPTRTFTITQTPSPTATTQCGVDTAALALLEEYTSSCSSNSVYHLFAVVNNGAAVTLSDITIKFWPYDTSGVSLVGQVTTDGCLYNPSCFHNVTGVSLSALNFSPACGPTSMQMANWEMTLSTTDNTVLSQGVSWVSLQTLVTRSDSQSFVPGTSYWYSPCVMASTYSTNSHYAIYLRGNLVSYAGGVPPSCRPLATCTPIGGKEVHPGNVPTATLTPAPTETTRLTASVVAAPNISKDSDPINFQVNLNQSAQLTLNLYNLAGEKVYSANVQGTAGMNSIEWTLLNNGNQPVASGLYIYTLSIGDGYHRTGKVVVIH